MPKVYFDASVIISGLISSIGGSAKLLELVKLQAIIGITSQTVLDEVLSKSEKISLSPEKIALIIKDSKLLVRTRVVPKEIAKYEKQINKEDAHLIAGARLTKCQYLVSLDKKHVLDPEIKKKFMPLIIVSPKELLELII